MVPPHYLRALWALPVLFSSMSARADIPPGNLCDASGQSCDNAPNPSSPVVFDAGGVCMNSSCSRVGPGADGAIGTTMYDCMLCLAPEGGPSSTDASASGSSSGTSSSSGSSSSGSKSSGGCTVEGIRSDTVGPAALVVAGAALVIASRRRRSR